MYKHCEDIKLDAESMRIIASRQMVLADAFMSRCCSA
jgi:hypothetical protein